MKMFNQSLKAATNPVDFVMGIVVISIVVAAAAIPTDFMRTIIRKLKVGINRCRSRDSEYYGYTCDNPRYDPHVFRSACFGSDRKRYELSDSG